MPRSVPAYGPSALSEEMIAAPDSIERRIERVDSDEERSCFLKTTTLHLCAGQKIKSPNGLHILGHPPGQVTKPSFRFCKVALLIRAQRPGVGIGSPTGRRRRCRCRHRQECQNDETPHEHSVSGLPPCSRRPDRAEYASHDNASLTADPRPHKTVRSKRNRGRGLASQTPPAVPASQSTT